LFTTSTGNIQIGDMRKKGVCDKSALVLSDKVDESAKNFFTEIISSISDATCNNI
jgi:serine/threonine-protein phosphatase 2A regulatory subunit B